MHNCFVDRYHKNQVSTMEFTQPRLPYTPDALAPVISHTTVEYHWGKHEKAYIDTLNRLVKDSPFSESTIEEIIREAEPGPLLNNAAQAWNHIFYFFQFSPVGRREPQGALHRKIVDTFGSFDEFKTAAAQAGATLFGSGWVWLSADSDGNLFLTQGSNADNPMRHGLKPILTIDVWEHAYYLDYQNRRPDYLSALWSIIDWEVIETRYTS